MIIEFGDFRLDPAAWIIVLSGFLLAFAITYFVIPSIIKVAKDKHLFDEPDQRKSHTSEIPTLGGAAVFLGMIIPTTLIGNIYFGHEVKYIIASLLILFFIGIKDDILEVSPNRKLIAEIMAIVIVIVMGDIRVSNFHGFLGINELPYYVSIAFTLFTFIVIINGFNLIDGIDGLSAGVGILTITSLGIWFLMIKDYPYATFSFSIVGALFAFIRFNIFGKKNKIFLGDTGSLIIGMIVSIFTVKFLEGSLTETVASINLAAPAISIGLLIVPLVDTLRVFTLRVIVGKSPFQPDRFHTHHKLLLLGFTHLHTTLYLLAYNLIILVLAVSLRYLGNIKMLIVIIPVSVAITSIPGLFFRYKVRRFLNQIIILRELSWVLPITITNFVIRHFPGTSYNDSTVLGDQKDKEEQLKKDLDAILHNAYLKFRDKDYVKGESGEQYDADK